MTPLGTDLVRDDRYRPLTGWSGDAPYFRFGEYERFQPEAVVDVLRGRVAGVVFRAMVDAPTCTALAERFWASPARVRRGADAPGYYIGTYHYEKTTVQYLDDCDECAAGTDEVLDIPDEPLTRIGHGLSDVLAADGAMFRPARHGGREACRALLRSWHGQGAFALLPHEDFSQCADAKQADFEIQGVRRHHLAALNVCLENGDGGRLVYWNIRPDRDSRRRLGLEFLGSPYPAACLDGIPKLELDVHPGDVYVFNSAHVHAVEPNTDPALRRTTVAIMLGFIDAETVVSWT